MQSREPACAGMNRDRISCGVFYELAQRVGFVAGDRAEVTELVEQIQADQIEHDEEIEAEDGAAGADLEGGDGHGHGAGDKSGGGGDEKGYDNAINRDAAEDLRDGKDGDAADEQGDNEKEPAQQGAQDDLAIAQGGGQENVVSLAVFFLCDSAGGEDWSEQSDQSKLKIAEMLEDLGLVLASDPSARSPDVAAGKGEDDQNDEKTEIAAADDQIARCLPPVSTTRSRMGLAGIRRQKYSAIPSMVRGSMRY